MLLALINSHDYVQSDETAMPKRSRFVGSKVVPFLEHKTVTLRLPRKIVETKMIREAASAIPRRAQEVGGSWRTNRRYFPGLPNCDHVYVPETSRREVCVMPGCGHKKWWVNDYVRGNPELGTIRTDFIVTN
jgi:hypothetical protein